MSAQQEKSRREFLTGRRHDEPPDQGGFHISSAVVTVLPHQASAVIRKIAELPGTQVTAHSDSRVVVVMEASSAGELGERLAAISGFAGVISANMVFEQADTAEEDQS